MSDFWHTGIRYVSVEFVVNLSGMNGSNSVFSLDCITELDRVIVTSAIENG